MVQDVRMLYSPRVTSREVIITFYQRTLLGTSANQKIHYLKSYNSINTLPLDEGVNHSNTFIQGQYVFYYTECLMIQVYIMLLEGQLLKK